MQKISQCLWFDDQGVEAAKFYVSLFPNSKLKDQALYDEASAEVSGQKEGGVMLVNFELAGQDFIALNGGPLFKLTPAISFMVRCENEEELDQLWEKLVDGGEVLMELGKYDFSEKYGWLNDKYGVSWQLGLGLGDEGQKIVPSMLFVGEVAGKASEAMKFYVSVFKNSKVEMEVPYEEGEGDKGIKYGAFTLEGQEFVAMDSGLKHDFSFTEAVSLVIDCEDQKEVDYYWEKLTKDGGEESQCGWLKDKYGVSWQVVPRRLNEMLSDPDKEKAERAMKAMLEQKKIVLSEIEEAFEGK